MLRRPIKLWIFAAMFSLPAYSADLVESRARPHHHTSDGFQNYPVTEEPAKLGLEFYWQRFLSSLDTPRVPASHYLPEGDAIALYESLRDENTVTWIGQSTLLIKIDGTVILTDPFFSKNASPYAVGPERFIDAGISPENLPGIDIVLISHNHYDHLDEAFVEALPNKAEVQVFTPLRLGSFFRERGYRHVHELDWHESWTYGGFRFTALPSVHYSGRGLGDRNETLWCSWAISSTEGNYFFIGDSAYSPTLFAEIGRAFGSFDLAMLTIGTYGNRKYGVDNHTTPEQAVMVARELNAEALLGIHWGTIDLSEEDPWEPPARFRVASETAGFAPEDVWLMKIGETRVLPK